MPKRFANWWKLRFGPVLFRITICVGAKGLTRPLDDEGCGSPGSLRYAVQATLRNELINLVWGVCVGKDPCRDNCWLMMANRSEGVGEIRLGPNWRGCLFISE